ncbi:MAG: hypothetical protein ACMG6S_03860, partial [Byssovorax sp.]
MSLTSLLEKPWRSGGALLVALLCLAAPARGQDAGVSGSPDAGVAVEVPAADPRTSDVRALIGGTLDPALDAQSLFDVSLSDEDAVQIEGVRVRALLRTVEESARLELPRRDRASPTASALPAASTRADIETIDAARWGARVDLDRARLEFYSLPRAQREELLRAHAARREAARPRETEEQRRAREAEAERLQALERARSARSEAERLVGEEVAYLIGVERSVEAVRERLRGRRAELASRRDSVLGWQRRARGAEASPRADADATYDALRRALRASRDELGQAIDALDASSSEVPDLGPDPLEAIPPDISTDQARERRALVERSSREARAEERSLREERASILQDEIASLNRERLGLLPYLSEGKRAAVTGFTEAGFDHVRSETRHLLLILRYHRHVAAGWIHSIRAREGVQGVSLWKVAAVAVPWLLVGLAFVWWRRRSSALLVLAEGRI